MRNNTIFLLTLSASAIAVVGSIYLLPHGDNIRENTPSADHPSQQERFVEINDARRETVESDPALGRDPDEPALLPVELNEDPGMETESFALETGTFGLSSMYPFSADDVYKSKIQLARNGNPEAQYWVARSMYLCTKVGNLEQIAALRAEGAYAQEFVDRIEIDARNCQYIQSQVESDQLNSNAGYIEWMMKAAKGGSILAKAWQVERLPASYEKQEAKTILKAALKTGELSPIRAVVNYYASHEPENQAAIMAWEIAGCRMHPSCDSRILEAQFKWNFHAYQYKDGFELADEIESSLSQKKWGSLGL